MLSCQTHFPSFPCKWKKKKRIKYKKKCKLFWERLEFDRKFPFKCNFLHFKLNGGNLYFETLYINQRYPLSLIWFVFFPKRKNKSNLQESPIWSYRYVISKMHTLEIYREKVRNSTANIIISLSYVLFWQKLKVSARYWLKYLKFFFHYTQN